MHTIFILLTATDAWLRLTRERRAAISAQTVGAALDRRPALRLRYFDAEAFTAVCSDVMMIETADLQAYEFFIEDLRDSPIFGTPYFRVEHIICAREEGYRAYEAASAST